MPAERLMRLAELWPVGCAVIHESSGWVGRVVADPYADLPGADFHVGQAHCLLGPSAYISLVWQESPEVPQATGASAWINVAMLQRAPRAPRERRTLHH